MKRILLACLFSIAFSACAYDNPIIDTAVIIGDPTIINEKVMFPVFLEKSRALAQMEALQAHELIRKYDRVEVEVINLKRATSNGWSPTAKFIKKARN